MIPARVQRVTKDGAAHCEVTYEYNSETRSRYVLWNGVSSAVQQAAQSNAEVWVYLDAAGEIAKHKDIGLVYGASKIDKVEDLNAQHSDSSERQVTFRQRLPVIQKNAWRFATNPAPAKSVQATDRALALCKGAVISAAVNGQNPGHLLQRFSRDVPAIGNQTPSIDHNPYNFVEFAASEPWLEAAPNGGHAGHDVWGAELLHGEIEVKLTARTPCFFPEGRKWAELEKAEEKVLHDAKTARPFLRMTDAHGKERYAIPGSSFKGALRTAVEALSNDRFGAVNDYSMPHPYRRRVFQVGKVTKLESGDLQVRKHRTLRNQPEADYKPRNLLWALPGEKSPRKKSPRKPDRLEELKGSIRLPREIVDLYHENLKHPHYERHFNTYHPKHDGGQHYRKEGFPATVDEARKNLQLDVGDTIYYTVSGGQVDSFGKHPHYLWPAKHSIHCLAKAFFQPDAMKLQDDLGIAERLFGWAKPHKDQPASYPFRGKVRFTTLWGPEQAAKTTTLQLAPLTSPGSPAKCRPLYLKPKPEPGNGESASFSDQNPDPQLRGRKFYWKQRWGEGKDIWPKHKADLGWHAASQLPPPVAALPEGTQFCTHLFFENLTPLELGALLAALIGLEENGRNGHCLHLGKGRPRGMGVFRSEVKLTVWSPQHRYTSLASAEASPVAPKPQHYPQHYIDCFRSWCQEKSNEPSHLRDFQALSRWPDGNFICYYPPNYSQYSWLPDQDRNPDEPRHPARRPPAMRPARESRQRS